MSNESIFDTPVLSRIPAILHEVRKGQLRIPAFQRGFEWKDEDRLMLLDSIYQGLPIGSLLVWRPSHTELKATTQLGPHEIPANPEEKGGGSYLLDGLQRMTTLYAALTPLDGTSLRDPSGKRWPIYFDLRAAANESPFFLLHGRRKPEPWHLPMDKTLDNSRLYDFQKPLWDAGLESEAEQAERVANRFKDYTLPVIPLRSDDLRLVTESFVRVNRQGRPVSELHMVQAILYAEYGLEERLKVVKEQLADVGWGKLPGQEVLNILKVRWGLDVYSARPEILIEKLREEADMDALFGELAAFIRQACSLLEEEGIYGPASLPYAYQLVAIVELLRRLENAPTPEQRFRIHQWFWVTTFTENFTGYTGSRIREAINTLEQWIRDAVGFELPDPGIPLPFIDQFRYQAVRAKAVAIQMARLMEDVADQEAALARLGEEGSGALELLDPKADALRPECRVLLPSSRALRSLRKALHPTKNVQLSIFSEQGPDQVIHRYLGIPNASVLMAEGGLDALLQRRRQMLEEAEQSFWRSLLAPFAPL